jgi:hypothetical protein
MAKDKGMLASAFSAFRGGEKGDLVSAVGTKAGPNPQGNKPAGNFRAFDPRAIRGKRAR